MYITAISDTHGKHEDLTDSLYNGGDVLIHAGDGSNSKEPAINEHELIDFLTWFDSLPNWRYKIFVPGNHDTSMYKGLVRWDDHRWSGMEILINRSISIGELKFYGSPYTPEYGFGWGWNMKRHRINYVWNSIPDDTNILITHGPPQGHLDISVDMDLEKNGYVQCGCGSLRYRIDQIDSIKTHIFGHIHNRTDVYNHGIKYNNGMFFVNATNTVYKYNQDLKHIEYVVANEPITFQVESNVRQ